MYLHRILQPVYSYTLLLLNLPAVLFAQSVVATDTCTPLPDSTLLYYIRDFCLCSDPLPVFSNFDSVPYGQSGLKTYWAAFDDTWCGGTSEITRGIDSSTEAGGTRFTPSWEENTGSNFTGHGLSLEYRIGTTINGQSPDTTGFIGMECNLYDSAKAEYWDATTSGIESVYFRYITQGNDDSITFTLKDYYDSPDADQRDKKDTRGKGIYWHKRFPPSGGCWYEAYASFNSLVCSNTGDSLDPTRLAQMQFTVHGSEGQSGVFAIDDIYFSGGIPNRSTTFKIRTANRLSLRQSGNILSITLPRYTGNRPPLHIEVCNAKGTMQIRHQFPANETSTSLRLSLLPSGVYFIRIMEENGGAIRLSGSSIFTRIR